MQELIRADLREKYQPYRSARDVATPGKVFLNANESPFDDETSSGVKLNRYPEKQAQALLTRLAAIMQVQPNQMALARGSDEFIDLLIRLFCRAGTDAILTCSPTYGMYAIYATLQNARIIDVPLARHNHYQLDMAAIEKSLDASVKIIFLCSPNNPTGNLLNKNDILTLCRRYANQSIVVVDEAYIDFADATSLSAYLTAYPNLVILRTLSKAYGLANARCGVVLASPVLIEWLLKIIAPYPLSGVITQLVLDALSPALLTRLQQAVRCIQTERQNVMATLSQFSFIKKIWPSDANFILIETERADEIMQVCNQQGIILRSMFDKTGLAQAIRLSIGSPEDNHVLLSIFKGVDQ